MGTHAPKSPKFLKISRTSVNKLVQTFLEERPEGRQEKPMIHKTENWLVPTSTLISWKNLASTTALWLYLLPARPHGLFMVMDNFPLKTRQHTYGLKKQLAQEPWSNNNLCMLICSVQSSQKRNWWGYHCPWVNKDIMIEHGSHGGRTSRRRCNRMAQDGIQKKLPMTLKCQCHQTFALFSRAKPYRTSMALVEATLFSQPIFYWLPRHHLQSQRWMKSVFGLLQKSHQNAFVKMDRPNQLIFQMV